MHETGRDLAATGAASAAISRAHARFARRYAHATKEKNP